MSILSHERSAALAERVIEASRADETEVTVCGEVDRFARFADVGPTQSADRRRVEVAVRVRLADGDGWREARSSAGTTDEAAVLAALERATALAGASPANPEALPLAGAVDVRPTA